MAKDGGSSESDSVMSPKETDDNQLRKYSDNINLAGSNIKQSSISKDREVQHEKGDKSTTKTDSNPATPQGKPVKEVNSEDMALNSLCLKITLITLGGIFVLFGVTVGCLWPTLLDMILKKELTLAPDSKSFNLWKETPLPLYIDFYMFNWTNAEDSLMHGHRPVFSEMGPYVFRESHSKVNLTWNSNSTITFQQIRKWNFVESLSKGSLKDKVTNINTVAMTIASMVKKFVPKRFLPMVDSLISIKENPYVTQTVGELLFDGYKDPLLSVVAKIKTIVKDIDIPFDKFGWFYGRNMSSTYDGIFNMYTGEDNISSLGNLYAWNYTSKTKYFQNKCAIVEGTTGELWPPNSALKDSANIFASDICSSLLLTTKTNNVQVNGLTGTQFSGSGDAFVGNSCYCINRKCPLDGVREISTCRYGAPAFVSFPHFYLADPKYNKDVSGLHPNKDLHSFQLVLDDVTGVPLKINARLQVNILSEPLPGISIFHKLPKAMMPMIWFDQHAAITDTLAGQLNTLATVNGVVSPVLFGLAGFGLLLILIFIILFLRGRMYHKPESEHLISTSSVAS